MAWKYQCVLFMMMLSVQHSGTFNTSTLPGSERATNQKTNGSYKIINRHGKPFVNKRVPEGSVIFPGPTTRSGDDFTFQIPEECKRLGICEVAPSDKDDLVAAIIKDLLKKNKTFNTDELDTPEIAQRTGSEEDVELCISKEKLYTPRQAQDANNQWHRIINDESNALQRFRVEYCTKLDAPCLPIAIFQQGYQSRCIQKYVLRNMVALNSRDEVIEKAFKVPSCCSCVARFV